MDKELMKPVAWIDDDGMVFWANDIPEDGTNLYTTPPVPRDVLMAFGIEIADKAHAAGAIGDTFIDEEVAAIADRYASKVQPEPVEITDDAILAIGKPYCKDVCHIPVYSFNEREFLAIARRIAAATQPEPVNQQGMRKKFEEWAPAKGYDIRPSRIGLPFADGFTNSAWEIWQAAIAAAEAAQCKCQRLGDYDGHTHHMLCDAHNPPYAKPAASAQPVAVPDGARKVFICDVCEGVYADEPVTNCDCTVSEKTTFSEGYIVMLSAAQKPEGVPEVKDKYSDWPELATVKLQWATDYTTGWGRRGADGKIRPIYGDDTREPLDMNCWIIIAEREAAGKKGGAA